MIGIKSIASCVPEARIDNLIQGKHLHESEEFILKKIGALYLPQKKQEEETSDLAVESIRNLIRQSALETCDIDVIVVVTQNGDGEGLPHTSAVVHQKLQLQSNVAAFDVSLGCSGYVYGLSIIKGFMEQAGFKNGVLVTADPYSKVVSKEDRTTTLLFGDAATATWMGASPDWLVMQPSLCTDGSGSEYLKVKDGTLAMNGRQVFNFASKRVPSQIRECLANNDVEETEIDLYLMHQGSASIVDAIAKRFPAIRERFTIDLKGTGNTVSSSIPLLLEKEIQNKKNRRILISGFGVGLSWASNILSRSVKHDH